MPDLILFRVGLKSSLYRFLLLAFSLFFVAGNFFRFLTLGFFQSNFSLAEMGLYAIALPLYFAKRRRSQWIVFAILVSGLYGVILHRFDLSSLFYGAKAVGMIASGVVIGDALWRQYGDQLEAAIWFFLRLFLGVLIIGAAIYLAFPKAMDFFALLGKFGIHFHGDPHVKRFISPFFDPNYYAVIATIPLILLLIFPKKRKGISSLSFLLLVSILLSWSRGGIATCLATLTISSVVLWCYGKRGGFKPRVLIYLMVFVPLIGGILFFVRTELGVFAERLFEIGEDQSAYARFENLSEALYFFKEYPFWGVGFNYLPKLFLEKWGFVGIDSSLLTLLCCFGLVPTLGFLLCGAIWFLKRVRSYFNLRKSHPFLFRAFWALSIYLGVCSFFTSWLINLWSYPYWLIPMIALFTYLDRNILIAK